MFPWLERRGYDTFRRGSNVPFLDREWNALFGGRNVFLAGEKRVKFLVEREKCSFFQRAAG
jgi:hypothetical protein